MATDLNALIARPIAFDSQRLPNPLEGYIQGRAVREGWDTEAGRKDALKNLPMSAEGGLDYNELVRRLAEKGDFEAFKSAVPLSTALIDRRLQQEAFEKFMKNAQGLGGGAAPFPTATPTPATPGPGASLPGPMPPMAAGPPTGPDLPPTASNPIGRTGGAVASTPRVWGDREAIAAGIYDDPSGAPQRSAYAPEDEALPPGAQPTQGPAPGGVPLPRPRPTVAPPVPPAGPTAAPNAAVADRFPTPTGVPPRSAASPVRSENPFSGQIMQALAGLNPRLPKSIQDVSKVMLEHALKSSDLEKEEKLYLRYAAQESSAGRPVASFVDWDRANRRASTRTGDDAFETKASEVASEVFKEALKDYPAARQDRALITRLGEQLEQSGTGANVAFSEWVRSHTGINFRGARGDAAAAAQSLIAYMQPRMRVAGSGASTDKDMEIFARALPSLLQTAEGKRIVIQTLGGIAQMRVNAGEASGAAIFNKLPREAAWERIQNAPDPFEAFREYQLQQTGRTRATGGGGGVALPPGVGTPYVVNPGQ